MTEYVCLYEFYEIFLCTTFWKDKPLHWHKSSFEPDSKGNIRIWAGFELVQLMTIVSYM